MDTFLEVGRKLRLAREACTLSKLEVAKALGMHASTLMRWEDGDRLPKQADLSALASIYQVEADWLLEGSPDEAPERSLDRRDRAKAILHRLQETDPGAATLCGQNIHKIRARQLERRIDRRKSLAESEEAILLAEITSRIRPIMLAQHRLPIIQGVSKDVVLAIRDGAVIPSLELICELAMHLNVYSGWLLRGEESKEQSDRIE